MLNGPLSSISSSKIVILFFVDFRKVIRGENVGVVEIECLETHYNILKINPCHAEPRYTLSLQTV